MVLEFLAEVVYRVLTQVDVVWVNEPREGLLCQAEPRIEVVTDVPFVVMLKAHPNRNSV